MPFTISPPEPTVVSKIKADYSWLIHHILLLVITGILVIGSVYGVESLIARHDVATESKYSTILAAQVQQTKIIESQLAAQELQSEQIEKTLLAQNAQLAKTIATENQQISQQRKVDATLNASQTAQRISEQTNSKAGEVVARGDNIVLDLPIARTVTANLDSLAGTQTDLVDTQRQLANEIIIEANDKVTIGQQATDIANLKTVNAGQIKVCNAQIAVVKAQARKSKFKWFVSGVVVGFIGKRLLIGKW